MAKVPKPPPIAEVCETCKYFQQTDMNSMAGKCWRFPAKARREKAEFCGEWTVK